MTKFNILRLFTLLIIGSLADYQIIDDSGIRSLAKITYIDQCSQNGNALSLWEPHVSSLKYTATGDSGSWLQYIYSPIPYFRLGVWRVIWVDGHDTFCLGSIDFYGNPYRGMCGICKDRGNCNTGISDGTLIDPFTGQISVDMHGVNLRVWGPNGFGGTNDYIPWMRLTRASVRNLYIDLDGNPIVEDNNGVPRVLWDFGSDYLLYNSGKTIVFQSNRYINLAVSSNMLLTPSCNTMDINTQLIGKYTNQNGLITTMDLELTQSDTTSIQSSYTEQYTSATKYSQEISAEKKVDAFGLKFKLTVKFGFEESFEHQRTNTTAIETTTTNQLTQTITLNVSNQTLCVYQSKSQTSCNYWPSSGNAYIYDQNSINCGYAIPMAAQASAVGTQTLTTYKINSNC